MVDVPNNTSTTATLAFGGTYSGEIETAGDEDWVAVTLNAGVTYAIQMTGSTIGDGTLVDPFIKGLYTANGTSLDRADDDGGGSRNSQLVFTPGESGTYYVSAGGWDTEIGTYQMSLEEFEAEAPSPTSNAVVDQVDISGDDRVDSLLDLFRYQNIMGAETTSISFSIPNASSAWSTSSNGGYGPEDGDGEPWNGISYLTTAEANLLRGTFSEIEGFAAISFDEVADNASSAGTIRVAWTDVPDDGTAAYAFTPSATAKAGDIWIVSENQSTGGRGSYFQLVLNHELGHALGLKHPFDEDGSGVIMSAEYDGLEYTVMSYNVSIDGEDILGASFYPTSYMYLDILAFQYLYGETETAVGDTTYTFAIGTSYYETIWDTSGIDTYDASSQTTGVDLDLTPGSWSDVGTTISLYRDSGPNSTKVDTVFTPPEITIENAAGGSGSDRLTGNDAANTLRGNDGNDTLDGGAGGDVLSGGAGNDEISGGDGNDIVWAGGGDDNITGGDGDDQIGTGAGNDVVDGGAGANLIFGADGNDTITLSTNTSTAGNGVAWGGNGNDEIYGGSGDDRIGTGNGNDAAEGGAGDDTLYGGSADYADELDGGSGDDELYGGGGGDALEGGSGDDVIWGGAGDDTITGGAGDDEISGGPGSDELIFTSGHGDDVVASFSVGDDMLDLSGTNTNFTSAASVQAAASNTTVSGDTGVMIDTGGGDSIFLIGITTANLLAVDYTF